MGYSVLKHSFIWVCFRALSALEVVDLVFRRYRITQLAHQHNRRPMISSLIQLEKNLHRHAKPIREFGPVQKRAAVAILLRQADDDVEMLMIRRATREGDPWSGHMGFPGGRRDPEDRDDLHCAKRETWEEVGVELDECAELICALGEVNTGWRPDRPEILVAPFVFALRESVVFELNYEVDEVIWVPLSFLQDGAHRTTMNWEWQGQQVESDSYLFQDRRIWGLSLMMIDELCAAAIG